MMTNFLQSLNPNLLQSSHVTIPIDIRTSRENYFKALKHSTLISIDNNANRNDVSKIIKDNINKFDEQIKDISNKFKELLLTCGRDNPVDMHLTIKEILIDFFSRRVKQYCNYSGHPICSANVTTCI